MDIETEGVYVTSQYTIYMENSSKINMYFWVKRPAKLLYILYIMLETVVCSLHILVKCDLKFAMV